MSLALHIPSFSAGNHSVSTAVTRLAERHRALTNPDNPCVPMDGLCPARSRLFHQAIALLALSLGACGSGSLPEAPVANLGDDSARRDAGADTTRDQSCAALTYESFGKTFVETYCAECHNATSRTSGLGGVILDTLPMIVKNKMYLQRTVVPRADGRLPPMPKGGNDQLTDAERTKFGAWIACGPN